MYIFIYYNFKQTKSKNHILTNTNLIYVIEVKILKNLGIFKQKNDFSLTSLVILM